MKVKFYFNSFIAQVDRKLIIFSRLNEEDADYIIEKDRRRKIIEEHIKKNPEAKPIPESLEHSTLRKPKTVVIPPREKEQLRQEYLRFNRRQAKDKHQIELERSRTTGENSIEDKINEISKKLNNVVLKVNFNFDPLTLSFCDDNNQLINRANVDLGKLEVVIDEVYSHMHLIKFMGLKVESKKKLKVMGYLVKVNFFLIFFFRNLKELLTI